ncbi:hypothetical protein ACTHOQ_00845 [Solibacillus silvestris]|uniref:hypothetical protein n=1 Tax=Solibacillus silvestris TaxID=76853 RepID=UPI003F7CDC95
MDKSKAGTILGAFSIMPVIISIILFNIPWEPSADMHMEIIISAILGITGILLAVSSLFMAIPSGRIRILLMGLFGLSANVIALFFTFLLLVATGIGEP